SPSLGAQRSKFPSPSGGGQGGGIARAAVRGVAWQAVSFFAGKALVLVATAILAHLLAPSAFGVVALALVFITFADVVTDLGLAVVQGALSVLLAVAGYGPWAIIDGYLAGCVIWSLLLWAAVPYRPGLSFWRVRGAGLRPLLQFGAPAAGTALLLCLVFNV